MACYISDTQCHISQLLYNFYSRDCITIIYIKSAQCFLWNGGHVLHFPAKSCTKDVLQSCQQQIRSENIKESCSKVIDTAKCVLESKHCENSKSWRALYLSVKREQRSLENKCSKLGECKAVAICQHVQLLNVHNIIVTWSILLQAHFSESL